MPLLFRDLGFTKGAEIGVYRGRFSTTLCAPNPDLALIGVDAWDAYTDYKDYNSEDLQNSFLAAKQRTAGYNITLVKARSTEAAQRIPDESLDFVFIDANHDYEYVVEDIAAWSKKVRKGGLVCGHDYVVNTEFNFGVIDAVNGWCRTHNIKPLFLWRDQCPSWMYVKI
jgi:predicted O-methyltransferase YrrM